MVSEETLNLTPVAETPNSGHFNQQLWARYCACCSLVRLFTTVQNAESCASNWWITVIIARRAAWVITRRINRARIGFASWRKIEVIVMDCNFMSCLSCHRTIWCRIWKSICAFLLARGRREATSHKLKSEAVLPMLPLRAHRISVTVVSKW